MRLKGDVMTSETKTEIANDAAKGKGGDSTPARGRSRDAVAVSLAWLAVGIPLLWGVIQTLRRSMALFG